MITTLETSLPITSRKIDCVNESDFSSKTWACLIDEILSETKKRWRDTFNVLQGLLRMQLRHIDFPNIPRETFRRVAGTRLRSCCTERNAAPARGCPALFFTAWLIRYRSLEPSKNCTAALKLLNYFSAPLSALHVVQRAVPLAAKTLHHTCQIKLEGASKPPNRAWIKIWIKFNVLNSNMIQSMIYRDVAWRLLPAM